MTVGHNSGEAFAVDKLRSLVDRVERINSEIADLNLDKSEIFKGAKNDGFDPAIVKKVVAIRAKDPEKVAEQDALVATYMAALGGPLAHTHEG
jgi:uncharacterized protein (UPF0335 family)